MAALRADDPIIEVAAAPDGIYVNPQTLQPGEIELIGDALVRLLAQVAAHA
jgi:hypothetical protein